MDFFFSFCSGLTRFMKHDLHLSINIFDEFFMFKNPIWLPPNPKLISFAKFNGVEITEYIFGVPIITPQNHFYVHRGPPPKNGAKSAEIAVTTNI